MDQPAISRRTLARAAHWAVPVVIASTAAPAIAASAEPATMLWSGSPVARSRAASMEPLSDSGSRWSPNRHRSGQAQPRPRREQLDSDS